MENSRESAQLRNQKRVCQVCGKEYTINTTRQVENFANYPNICLWCLQSAETKEQIKAYAEKLKSKDDPIKEGDK